VAREWRLHAPHAGPGVPNELAGEVRVVTNDAAWIWAEHGPVVISSATALAGPITACTMPPEELARGHRVFLNHSDASGGDVVPAAPGYSGSPEVDRVELESGWLSERAESLASGPAADVAAEIAGWGPGLTPSGDDVLIGYVLARRTVQREGHAGEVDDIVEVMRDRSGEPSLSLVRWAAKGQAFAVVMAALEALLENAPGDHRAVAALGSLGHESGRATLVGLAAGLRAG